MSSPTVVIHGGAGSALDGTDREQTVRAELERILDELWEVARQNASAMELVERGSVALEDCEEFNAGHGSKLQRDGGIRMSAAVMEGDRRAFSGVINAEWVKNPTKMAMYLQQEDSRVLDGRGAELLARQMGMELFDPIEKRRFSHWLDKTRRHRLGEKTQENADGTGTVGIVVRDAEGQLAAATSTGGRGFERVGRVSDTPTVAGNYATDKGAVSATGNGEDIIDEALAARIVIRAEDGQPLSQAVEETIAACDERDRRFGVIAVDAEGQMSWATTTEVLLAVGRSEEAGTRWAF